MSFIVIFAVLTVVLLAVPMAAVMRIALNAERKHGRAWQPRLSTGLEEYRAV